MVGDYKLYTSQETINQLTYMGSINLFFENEKNSETLI